MSDFTVEEAQHTRGAKIKIIGCGGGGGNTINHMIQTGLSELDLIVANTDKQALNNSLAKTRIQLGEKKTRGLGAGGNPDVGAESAKENYEELKAALEQSDIVFIASGLGGGTGTGATPIVAQAAKEIGALTVSVVTMPFNFEGKQKKKFAEKGLAELRKESDSILVIQNEKLRSLVDKKAGVKEAYAMVDNVLARAVKGMVSLLLENSQINVDFADIKTIMSHRGLALMGMGEAKGEGAAMAALENALESPLLEGLDIKKAKGVIVHFKHHPDFSFFELGEVGEHIQNMLGDDTNFKYGDSMDESMDEDAIEITIIATGFEYDNKGATLPTDGSWINRVRTGTDDAYGLDNEPAFERQRRGGLSSDFENQPAYLRRQMD